MTQFQTLVTQLTANDRQTIGSEFYDPELKFFHKVKGDHITGVDTYALVKAALAGYYSKIEKITILAPVWCLRSGPEYPVMWEYGGKNPDPEKSSTCQIVGSGSGYPTYGRYVRRVYYPFSSTIPSSRQAMASITHGTVFAIGYAMRSTECYLAYRIDDILPFPEGEAYTESGVPVVALNVTLLGVRSTNWAGFKMWDNRRLEIHHRAAKLILDAAKEKLQMPRMIPSYIEMTWEVDKCGGRPHPTDPKSDEVVVLPPSEFVSEIRGHASAYRTTLFRDHGRKFAPVYRPIPLLLDYDMIDQSTTNVTCHICRRAEGDTSDLSFTTTVTDRFPPDFHLLHTRAKSWIDVRSPMYMGRARPEGSFIRHHLLTYW